MVESSVECSKRTAFLEHFQAELSRAQRSGQVPKKWLIGATVFDNLTVMATKAGRAIQPDSTILGIPFEIGATRASGVELVLHEISYRDRRRPVDTQKSHFELSSAMAQQAAHQWLEGDSTPRLIVTGEMSIMWANSAARSALAESRDVKNRAGYLVLAGGEQNEALSQFVKSCGAERSILSMARSNGDGRLILKISRIRFNGTDNFGICFFGSGSDFRPRYEDLDRAFGLTDAEHQVLLALLDGLDARQVADFHQVGVETVRIQIKSIYAKLRVQSREALVRKAQPFHALLLK